MLEIPEALTIAAQLGKAAAGRTVTEVVVNQTVHKMAWFYGDPSACRTRLLGRRLQAASARGGMVEVHFDDMKLVLCDGVNVRYQAQGSAPAAKHQLLLTFDDRSSMSAAVQMYGGIWCFSTGSFDNPYYLAAGEKTQAGSAEFSADYFRSIVLHDSVRPKSAKAALATEQRIPGLGNGVLQDILFNARIHPKRKISSLSEAELHDLYRSIQQTLHRMTAAGGRDTEKDLFGRNGGYTTVMSNAALSRPCPQCGAAITKAAYLGGSVYFCSHCQPLPE
ncbi:MAG: endonuclease VIII [Spirochaetes bacterium]|nr:endonuclease VIII [Spirochaetota bacterium]MBU0955193.1 endonuclease VIII [Spirochaetota bacterium]